MDSSDAVYPPPNGTESRAAVATNPSADRHLFYVAESPNLIAIVAERDAPPAHSPEEERIAKALLSADLPVAVFIDRGAPGTAVLHCYSNSELAVELAACGAWALKALGQRDESPVMAFLVSHISGYRRDEHGTFVETHAVEWVSACSTHRAGSVEIRRAPKGWSALLEIARSMLNPILVAADVDWAQAYNDAYGHREGDLMLGLIHSVAEAVADRASGVLVRVGGDELVIAIDTADPRVGLAHAEALTQGIYDENVPHQHPEVRTFGRVTVSAAMLAPSVGALRDEALLRNAVEDAVYQAKKAGRNTVFVVGE